MCQGRGKPPLARYTTIIKVGRALNQIEWDKSMNRLMGTYHEQNTSEIQRREMRRVLGHLPAEAFDRAVDDWLAKSEWFPKPSQLLALVDKGPGVLHAPCGTCQGTGWIETTAPEVDEAGNKAQGVEQPWVYKCKVCAGSGGGRG